MWIFTNKSFLSAVKHRDKPETIILRARLRNHLEEFIGDNCRGIWVIKGDKKARGVFALEVYETPYADYRFRVELPAEVFEDAVRVAASRITYDNFKNSIEDAAYHDAAVGVWREMFEAQRVEARRDWGGGVNVTQEDDGEIA